MKERVKKIGTVVFLLLAVTVGMLAMDCTETRDMLHIPSETTVIKAATKKQKIAAYNKKAKKAYKKFLKSYYVQGKSFYCDGTEYKWSDYRSTNRQYTIRDINRDGKLELLIYNEGRPEYYLFTYYKNKVKCVDVAGYHSAFCQCKKGKLIVISSANNGSEGNNFYLLQKGKLKCVGSVFIESYNLTGSGRMKNGKPINEWIFYNGKSKTISKAKFKKILKKYTGSTDIKAFAACYLEAGSKKVKTQLKHITFQKYKMPTVKKVTGIKIKQKKRLSKDTYSNQKNKYYMYPYVSITWNKSVAGSVQVTYANNKKFSNKKTKTIKASANKNDCLLKNLYEGETYYIKLRTYLGDKCAYSKYSKVYKITLPYYTGAIKKGNNLYYTYTKNKKSYMCHKNLKTNKVTKLISSNNALSLSRMEGKYIYYTQGYTQKSKLYSYNTKLYVYNTDTKQKRFMLDYVWDIDEIVGGKVFCQPNEYLMDYETAPLYSFDLDGTNKKKISDVYTYFSYNNKIYWCECKYVEDEEMYAYIWKNCDFDGKNKTTVTDWMYFDYDEDEEMRECMYSKEYVIKNYIEA